MDAVEVALPRRDGRRVQVELPPTLREQLTPAQKYALHNRILEPAFFDVN